MPAASAAAFAVIVAGSTAPVAVAAASPVRPTQAVAVLLETHAARVAPRGSSAVVQIVAARRPLTGERTVVPVIGRRAGARGVRWLHVLLPGRPNGHAGWVRQRATRLTHTRWHIVVDTSSRRVSVYRSGHRIRVFRAVVGKPATPTPLGAFFVEEAVQLRSDDAGAPFALALSARSDVLQEFDGGPGQIALHGTDNLPGALGTASSHGCVRLSPRAITWVARHIAGGTPLTITR